MKVARFSNIRPQFDVGSLFGGGTAGGPAGQVPTSNGSNVSWGSNVATIFANGSNQILGPAVNFAAGSNILFTFDGLVGSQASNTIRIHSTGGGGVSAVTSNGSNSLTGTINLVAGTGIALGVSGQTITVTNTGQGGGGTPASGVTHAYVGYNTIGGSNENAAQRIFLKKVTLANDCMIESVGVYVKQVTANEIVGINVGLLSDNAGDPENLLAASVGNATDGLFLATSGGAAGAARWFHRPLGYWATAGDYWLAVNIRDTGTGTTHNIYFDGSGSDKTYLPSSFRMSDEGWTATTSTTNRYSIRASTIR